jgi:LCP family protein required for cell wall assembly
MAETTRDRGNAPWAAGERGARATATARWAPVRSAPDVPPSTGRARVSSNAAGAAYGRARPISPPPGGPPSGPDWPGGPGKPYRGRRRNWKRVVLISCAVALVLAMLAVGGLYMYAQGLDKRVARTDPFSELTGGRPTKTVDGALNILMVGSDSRDPDVPIEEEKDARADTTILMHIPADHKEAYLVSIPRDLWVPVPESASAGCGGNRDKINAAFSRGKLPLAVRTVECFTDVRVDHVMAIDFAGFKDVTDALGGVDMNIERTITSIHKPYRKFYKGKQHLNGTQALDYIRQRKQFPDGDFARMRHQQQFLRALMDKAASTGTLTNPAKLNSFLKAVTKAVTVDEDFSLIDMGLQFRSLRGDNLKFITSPNTGGDTIDGQSVVVSDREKASALYQAMADDKMAEWVQANPSG